MIWFMLCLYAQYFDYILWEHVPVHFIDVAESTFQEGLRQAKAFGLYISNPGLGNLISNCYLCPACRNLFFLPVHVPEMPYSTLEMK